MHSRVVVFVTILLAIAVGHGNGAVIIAHDNGTNTIVLHRNVVANKNTDVELQCSGDQASWIPPENTIDRAEIRNETDLAFLSIRNVTESDSNIYTCQKSGILEHFHLRVIAPNVELSHHQTNFVRSGGKIELTCTVMSAKPVDEVSWFHNDTLIVSDLPQWESNNGTCYSKEETRFTLTIENVKLTDNGNYTCSPSSDNVMPESYYVYILEEPKIILQKNVSDEIRDNVIGYATEALEQHGLTQDLADTVRSKCDDTYDPYWNCIVGRNIHAFALSTNEINSANALIEFTFGSIDFLVFQTN